MGKQVLDIKLLPSGTSLTLRMKKPAQLTPSPSEFKSRQRPDAAGEWSDELASRYPFRDQMDLGRMDIIMGDM